MVHQNGDPFSPKTEPDFVIVETDSKPTEAPVAVETPEAVVLKEEIKKSKEEKGRLFGKMFKKKEVPVDDNRAPDGGQTDGGRAAAEPQLVSRLLV